MNVYIIVEGNQTELTVYPKWLSILAPNMKRVDNAWNITENNYYLFSAGGIPSIFDHVANAVLDINEINKCGKARYDCLMVCLDTEEESREYILDRIGETLDNKKVEPLDYEINVFEQKVCMETWFLGNSKVFKANPQDPEYIKYIRYYDVSKYEPEGMGLYDDDSFSTKAQFHLKYLKKMISERGMKYSKNNTSCVCDKAYLEQIINRYETTKHLKTFGSWYEFVKKNLV